MITSTVHCRCSTLCASFVWVIACLACAACNPGGSGSLDAGIDGSTNDGDAGCVQLEWSQEFFSTFMAECDGPGPGEADLLCLEFDVNASGTITAVRVGPSNTLDVGETELECTRNALADKCVPELADQSGVEACLPGI